MPNRATIEVYYPVDEPRDNISLIWCHEGYIAGLHEDANQHERFETPTGLIHVVVYRGSISKSDAYALALLYAKREFVAVPLNKLIER